MYIHVYVIIFVLGIEHLSTCVHVLISRTANLLLQDTIERIHIGNQFGDIPRGIFIVRGENMALCGEIVSHTVYYWLSELRLLNICLSKLTKACHFYNNFTGGWLSHVV